MLQFRTEKLSARITRIFAFSTELMYLVEGEDKAALLDTGSGFGSLKECVESLTKKPIVVLLTHGHVDHAMGAAEFDEVYMNRADDYIFKEHGEIEFRKKGLINPDFKISEADLLPTPDLNSFRNMNEGDVFDLGGVSIEVYDCIGHTRGSVVFLIKEERTLLLGDACNPFTFMFDTYSTSIAEYEASLHKLQNKVNGKYDTVLLSHGDGNGSREMIEGVVRVCKDIQCGNTDDIPFEFMGVKALIAKKILPSGKRADGGIGNIVYNKNKIGII